MFVRKHLSVARSSKRDEFYTLYEDVKFELDHYLDQLKDKIIYCPCDTKESSFVKYFLELEAKGLIKELLYTSLQDDVDCLSEAALDNYKRADVIVTNPPFSLFRQFLELLDKLDKKFIIWGTNNAVCYKQVSSMLVKDRIKLGYIANKTCVFEVPSGYADHQSSKAFLRDDRYYVKVASITTFTNLDVVRLDSLDLTVQYDPTIHQKYVNFDAINCNRVTYIPVDYDGYIGVPITYLAKHDSTKFKIIGVFNNYTETDLEYGHISGDLVNLDKAPWKTNGPCLSPNIPTYARLIIKRIV